MIVVSLPLSLVSDAGQITKGIGLFIMRYFGTTLYKHEMIVVFFKFLGLAPTNWTLESR